MLNILIAKVLVMDDEEMIRSIASEMLTRLDFSVVTCSTGTEAVELYIKAKKTDAPFCAVIVDLIIPGGMGGKDAAKRIRNFDPEAKLIVSSGYSDEPVMAHHLEYGFKGLLPKPYKFQDMSRVMGDMLPCKLRSS
jgi:CheY-like chemotaxis protein